MIRQVCLVFLFCLLIFYPAHGYAQALDEAAAAPAASASESTPAAPEPTSAPVAKGGGGWLQNWVTGSAEFVRVLEGILEQLARLFGIPVPFPAPQAEPGVPTADTGSSSPVAQPGTSDSGPTSGTTAPSDTSGVASSATGPITNPGVTSGGDGGTIAIPPRPADARGGRAFIESTNRMTRPQREQAVFDEISRGNVPEFVRTWKTIEATFTGRDGQTHTVRYRVLPDYLCIGSDDDFIRMPMDPHTAQRLADLFGAVLPTRKMVNDIYSQATLKLTPQPQPPGAQMITSPYFLRHQEMIERQRAGRGLGELTAGHKKDVCITNMLDRAMAQGKRQVAIYGWHQQNGRPIQPLSTIHESTYADYSHGIRLVDQTVNLDGVDRPIGEVLNDPQLWRLLSDEGQIRNTRAHR